MEDLKETMTQALLGDKYSLKKLEYMAGSGNAEAQYVLSCVLDNENSPFRKKGLGMYWLQKSAGHKYKPAIKRLKELSTGNSLEGPKYEYGLSDQFDGNHTPNRDFDTKNYHPNWTMVEQDKGTKEEPFVNAGHKAGKPSLGTFLFSSEGRTSQSDYFFFLCIWIFFWFIASAAFASAPNISMVGFLLFYPFLQIATKRCHDIGKYGIYLIIPFYFIYLLLIPGDKDTNEYGYPPVDYFNTNS